MKHSLKKLINKLLGKNKQVVCVKYTSRQVRQIRRALSEGFEAIWNGVVWVMTKVIYV